MSDLRTDLSRVLELLNAPGVSDGKWWYETRNFLRAHAAEIEALCEVEVAAKVMPRHCTCSNWHGPCGGGGEPSRCDGGKRDDALRAALARLQEVRRDS